MSTGALDLTVRLTPAYRRSAADTDAFVPVTVPVLEAGSLTLALTVEPAGGEESVYAVGKAGMYQLYAPVPSDGVRTEVVYGRMDPGLYVRHLTDGMVACDGWLWQPCPPPLVRVTAERELYLTDTPVSAPGALTVPAWRTDWLRDLLSPSEDVGELDDWRVVVRAPEVLPDLPVPSTQSVMRRFRMAEEVGWLAGKPAVDLTAKDLEDLVRLASAILEEMDADED